MFKRIIAITLSIIMLFSISVTAFAANPETPFDDSKFYEYGEYNIHYRVWKADNEKGQIFMIHGFALSSYCFTSLAKILVENGYTCVMADLPDFGYSSRETANTKKLPREDIMHSLMTYLSDDPWYVAAHSMGGYIALNLADKYPESVKNLLLYGTAGNSGQPDFMVKIMTSKLFIRYITPILKKLVSSDIIIKFLYAVAAADYNFGMNYDISYITDPYDIDGTFAGALYSFSMLPETNFDNVKKMSPVFYINGSKDLIIPEADRENLRKYLPEGSEDIIINGGGHMLIETHADEVADYTLKFIENNK